MKDDRQYWVGIPTGILDDYSVASLDDAHHVFFIDLLVALARCGSRKGVLPPLDDLARIMRCERHDVERKLRKLATHGLVVLNPSDALCGYSWVNPRYVRNGSRLRRGPYAKRRAEMSRKRESLLLMLSDRDGDGCAVCGSQSHPEIDHVVPISRGGSDAIDNLQILCRSCNRRKSDRLPEEWANA